MAEWTPLRKEFPEYFKEVIVMQQPSATADEIIVGWGLEDLGKRFPAAVLQRDLVSGALSSRARMAALMQQIVCCWIGPGMTPVTQVTDTDVAYPLKMKIRKFKSSLSQELKTLALKEGREVSFKMGCQELMQIVCKSVKEFREEVDPEELVLKALRRNGQLAFVPINGEFQKITQENSPWLEELKVGDLGGHRYPKSRLEDRFSWLFKGVPSAPDWKQVVR